MSRFLSWVAAAVICLGLANGLVSLHQSFADREWQWNYFIVENPWAVVEWILTAAAIGLVIVLAAMLRHRLQIGAGTSFIVTVVVGMWLMPAVASFWAVIQRQRIPYSWTRIDYFQWLLTNVALTREWVVAYVITALIAAMLGVAFGRYLVSPSPPTSLQPAGASPLSRLASAGRRLLQRMRPGPGDSFLIPVFTASRRRESQTS